jgi:hypothetical protein
MKTETPPSGRARSRSALSSARIRASAWAAGVLPGGEGPGSPGDGDRTTGPEAPRPRLAPRILCALAILVSVGAVAAVATGDEASPAFRSEDFNRTTLANTRWQVVDPAGDGTVATEGTWTHDAWLRLSVPRGEEHSPWDDNGALRLVQATSDTDFSAEASFETVPGVDQSQGLLVEQGESDWLRFGFYHDGTDLHAQAVSTEGGQSTSELDEPMPAGGRPALRVHRDGDDWTFQVTTDIGAEDPWTTVGSFSRGLEVTASGPYAGNTGDPAPPFTALVDYVVEASMPLTSEDTYGDVEAFQLTTAVEGEGTVTRSPDQASYPTGRPVTLTAEPAEGWAFAGWRGDLRGTNNPTVLSMDRERSVTAAFLPDTAPPVISGLLVAPSQASAVVRWATDELASSTVLVGTTPDLEIGAFGTPYLTRDHAVTVTGLTPGTTYYYSVQPTDRAQLTANSGTATFDTPASAGPAIDVWQGHDRVVGANGQAQTWVNVNGNISDPDGLASLSYSLNGAGARPLTIGPDERRLQAAGDFNAEVPFVELQPGPNEVVLTATDGAGQESSATVVLQRQQAAPPLPYNTDWSAATRIGDQAQVVDGKWGLDGSSIHVLEPGYDRVVSLGDVSWHDYEVTTTVTVHEIGPGAGGPNSGPALIGLGLHWQGHTARNGEQPGYYWYPTGALAWYRYRASDPVFELRGNDDLPIVRQGALNLEFGRTYNFRARTETVAGGIQYSFKAWAQGGAEPEGWDLTIVEDAGPATGSVALIAHHVDAQFGDVSITPNAPAQPPA